MRKLFSTGLVAALASAGLVLGAAGAAHADSSCSVGTTPVAAGAFGGSGAQVCINAGPVQGTVTATGDAASQTGYVVADGASANPGALSGYIGVDSTNGVVGCSSGDYTPGGTNNQILGIPPSQANITTLVSNSGPCAVAAP